MDQPQCRYIITITQALEAGHLNPKRGIVSLLIWDNHAALDQWLTSSGSRITEIAVCEVPLNELIIARGDIPPDIPANEMAVVGIGTLVHPTVPTHYTSINVLRYRAMIFPNR